MMFLLPRQKQEALTYFALREWETSMAYKFLELRKQGYPKLAAYLVARKEVSKVCARFSALTERFFQYSKNTAMTAEEIAELPVKGCTGQEHLDRLCDPGFATMQSYPYSCGFTRLQGEFGHDESFRYVRIKEG